MATLRITSILLIFFILLGFGPVALAQSTEEDSTQICQLAIWNPFQFRKAEYSIVGLRVNLFYGVNEDMTGVDLGAVNRSSGLVKGLQLGLVNLVADETKGLQGGFYNSAGDNGGAQIGILNRSLNMKGFQLGLINSTETMNGLQIALFYNSTEKFKGVQIGLLNFAWDNKPGVTFMPLINVSFH